jgi:hypothetical protein
VRTLRFGFDKKKFLWGCCLMRLQQQQQQQQQH